MEFGWCVLYRQRQCGSDERAKKSSQGARVHVILKIDQMRSVDMEGIELKGTAMNTYM